MTNKKIRQKGTKLVITLLFGMLFLSLLLFPTPTITRASDNLNILDPSGGDQGWSPVWRRLDTQWQWDQYWTSYYRHQDLTASTPYGQGTQLKGDRQSTASTAPRAFYQYRKIETSSNDYTLHLDFYLREDSSTTLSTVDNWEIIILDSKHSSWQDPLWHYQEPNCNEHGTYQHQIFDIDLTDSEVYLLIGHWDAWSADWSQGHTKYFNDISITEGFSIRDVQTTVNELAVNASWTVNWGPNPEGYLVEYFWSNDSTIDPDEKVAEWNTTLPVYSYVLVADYFGEFWYQIVATSGAEQTMYGPTSIQVNIVNPSPTEIPAYEDCYIDDHANESTHNVDFLRTGEFYIPPLEPGFPSTLIIWWTYLKFDISGFQDITSAKLRLYKLQSSSDNIDCFGLENNGWREDKLTWSTKGDYDDLQLVDGYATSDQGWHEWDVTGWITGHQGGFVSLVLKDGNIYYQSAKYASREYSTTQYRPQLKIEGDFKVYPLVDAATGEPTKTMEIVSYEPFYYIYDPPGDGSYQEITQGFEWDHHYQSSIEAGTEGALIKLGVSRRIWDQSVITLEITETSSKRSEPEFCGVGGDVVVANVYEDTIQVSANYVAGIGWALTHNFVNILNRGEGTAAYARNDPDIPIELYNSFPDMHQVVGENPVRWEAGAQQPRDYTATYTYEAGFQWHSEFGMYLSLSWSGGVGCEIGIGVNFWLYATGTNTLASSYIISSHMHLEHSSGPVVCYRNQPSGYLPDSPIQEEVQDYVWWFNYD